MKLAIFAHDKVGFAATSYILEHYPEDVLILVVTSQNEIFDLGRKYNARCVIFESEAQIAAEIDSGVDLGVCVWWPKIIKKRLIDIPKHGFINTHPSYLPYARGKHYNFWTLVEQVPFGVTIHRIDEGIDTGDILVQKVVPYDWTDTGETLYFKAQSAMIELFKECYPELRSGRLSARPQPPTGGSFHHSSELELASWVDLNKTYVASDLLNHLRARTFRGYPGCRFESQGQTYQIEINIKKVE